MSFSQRSRRSLIGVLIAGLLSAALASVGSSAVGATARDAQCLAAKPAVAANPTRILTIGDSLTSAASGDYTWRYFLWKHLVTKAGTVAAPKSTSFAMVGPYSDLVDPVSLQRDSDTYRCNFDKANGAWPGVFLSSYLTAISNGPELIGPMVTGSNADVLIVFAGINDIARNNKSAAQVITESHNLVTAARAANPQIKIVFVTAPSAPDPSAATGKVAIVNTFDTALVQQAPGWSSGASKVAVASTAKNWGLPNYTYDGTHPNPVGEDLIAADVADALHRIGVGPAAKRPLPNLASYVGPRDPATLAQPTVTGGTASLSWTLPLGSVQSVVERVDYTAGGGWTALGSPITLTNTSAPKPYRSTYNDASYTPGHVYQYRIISGKGTLATSGHWQYPVSLASNLVTVPLGATLPKPARVTGVSATPTVHGMALRWATTPKASGYLVAWHATGSSITYERAAATAAYTVTGLLAGRSYGFTVLAVQGSQIGLPSGSLTRTPKGNRMVAPAKPRLKALTKHRIRTSFKLVKGATQYLVQIKLAGGKWRNAGVVAKGPVTGGSLLKGKTYYVRVRPYDSYLAGPYSPAAKIKTK
ncbi:MAG TPA: GDSL-type esterase/lipase family protein [Marmoricola sp.]|nr:GDSL-type esterase/lipase family protein [Marmoricola sp.]